MTLRILVVDDERTSRVTTALQLAEAGYVAEAEANAFDALRRLDDDPWDVVLTDLRMPTMDGLQLLAEIKKRAIDTEVILMTAYGTVRSAVEAMRDGAADYLTKPVSFDELELKLGRIAETRSLRREVAALRRTLAEPGDRFGLVGRSPAMQRVCERIALTADTPSSVLVTGATGTGKEVVARALHGHSARRDGPLVAVACAAIPGDLAESELFGHEAGAFTGAVKRHRGKFEQAHRGTIFLDDVDDLPLAVQAKLLRALQERRFERVGGERTVEVDVRVVSATKVDIEELARNGRFRDDLLYRLRVLTIDLPLLRDRRDDILELAYHFLEGRARQADRRGPGTFSPAAMECLMRHPWPGNVRELEHAVESAVAVCRVDEILPEHLPSTIGGTTADTPFRLWLGGAQKVDLRRLVGRFEHEVIDWALERSGGHQGHAAERLGIPRTTLQSKLEKPHE